MRIRSWWFGLPFAAALGAAAYGVSVYRETHPEQETARLLDLLQVGNGAAMAEVGAGRGRMTVAAARLIGPSGKIYATELDKEDVESLRRVALAHSLRNVVPVQGFEDKANLPDACCDAAFMTKVYHHFTRPEEMNASLYKALKPGGRLAVIDFEPRWWRFWLRQPAGVPDNRGGHGMPIGVLTEEMTAAGFRLERSIPDWWRFPERRYCLIFLKN